MLPLLIPATLFFTIYYLRRHSIADAAVNIYLPIFLLLPSSYGFRIPHLPGLNFGEAASLPIVIALLVGHGREWKFQRADLWIALFFGGAYYSELSHSGAASAGLVGIGDMLEGVLPYILGKMLLEQDGVRERVARRYVYICFFVAVISVWEFRMGTDLFTTLESRIFSQPDIGGQFRGGFIRIAGTFGGSIQAGTVLSIAWLLSMWLGVLDKSRGNEPKYWGLRRSTILSLGIAGGLIMTLSRGPIIGTILAYVVARVGKAKNMGRAAIVTLVLVTIVGTVGVIQLKQYTSGDLFSAKTQEQMNAIYRRLLLDEYKPFIEKGGLFGYGVVDRPVVPGMFSIDNAFLNVQLLQGNLGLWTLLLCGLEALLAAFLAAYRSTQRVDIYFALCMAGGMAGFLLAMTSVWLGPPMFQLYFLLVGWSQSLRETQTVGEMLPQPANSRFSFRRVIA
jgi:hypothetical protein